MTTYRLSALKDRQHRLSILNDLRNMKIKYTVKWDKRLKEYLVHAEDSKEEVK